MDTPTISGLYENAETGTLKVKLLEELEQRIISNTKYSKEDLFHICKTLNKNPTIQLIPTTKAHNIIGSEVTIEMIVSAEEIHDYLTKTAEKNQERTFGNIRIKVAVRGDLDKHKISEIEKKGIDTKEIHSILL